ncbi:MAG TPA: DNA repair protein RecN [Actinomycetota bacterium]
MLRQLHISGLGVLHDLDLEFDPGLNVLTGETGAGKTMITVGLALALGGRGSVTMVRAGSRAARVQARFDAPPEAEGTGWTEDGELILARSVGADGRSSARVGGELAPVSALAGLAASLVEMHGQHQGLRLLSQAAQTDFLDRFAGAEHLRRVTAFRQLHLELASVRDRLEVLAAASREQERQIDLLAYQVREIEAAGIRPGELADLESEESRLAHAETLVDRSETALRALSGDSSGPEGLSSAAAALEEAGRVDPPADELARRARSLAEEAADLAREVRGYREAVELDPERLDEVRERIQALRALERKYGEREEEVLAYLEEARTGLASLAGSNDERQRLAGQAEELDARTRTLAEELSAARADASPRLAAAVQEELRELGMDGATVEVVLRGLPEVGSGGMERVEFLFSAGSGQLPLPLAKVASGGELSRTMLACRSVLVDLDDVPTLVFDEVDAGIGGRAAAAVGRRLARLGRVRQVLVVTHLPQIAAFADRHVRVEKKAGSASAFVLEGSERVAELSRMLSGLPASETAALHAEELLAEAAKAKRGRVGAARTGGGPARRGSRDAGS